MVPNPSTGGLCFIYSYICLCLITEKALDGLFLWAPHRINGHECEPNPGNSEGQGRLTYMLQFLGVTNCWSQLSDWTTTTTKSWSVLGLGLEAPFSPHTQRLAHCAFVTQLWPTLCDPMDCSPPGSSVHEIFQVRILEWVAISFSRGSSQPRDRTQVSCIAGLPITCSQ